MPELVSVKVVTRDPRRAMRDNDPFTVGHGEAAQNGFVACVGSDWVYSIVLIQRWLPSCRLKQISERLVPLSVACVTNTRSPQIAGVEFTASGSGTFQRMF